MTKKSILMNLSIFFIFLVVPHSSVSLDYFQTCKPKNCGTVTVTYPFYIKGEQHPFCGHPSYEVAWFNKNDTIIKLSDDNYVIQQISYEHQTVNLVNTAFFNSVLNCSLFVNNLTLDKNVFQFTTQPNEIIFLQNCTERGKLRIHQYDELLCKLDGNRTREIVAALKENVSLGELGGEYGSIVSVPYEKKHGVDIESILRRGLVLKWTVDGCHECANSGGRCGYNTTTSQLQCYCPYGGPAAYRCQSNASHNTKKKTVGLIFGSSVTGGIIILTVTAVLALCYRKKRKLGHSKFVSQIGSIGSCKSGLEKGSIYFGVPLFSYNELEEATDNFNRSKELGHGGFGTVYHGKLRDGREVAVKRLFERSYKRVEQFLNEVQILTCLQHQNLVSLYGCTSSHCRELLLVYEYIPNGTVADHLYGSKSKPSGSLPWYVRFKIALETASALTYLHASDIIHRDVKTNNILLDSSFNVKVADFGLSRLFPNDVTHVSTAPQGTPGYLDPEYHQCYQLTDKSDVYSFGIVLMELVSSLPAVDMNRVKQEINLSNYAMNKIQRSEFHLLVDPQLGFGSDFKVRRMTIAVAELAFQCLQHDKEFRPSMAEVLEGLKRIESVDYHVMKDNPEVEKINDDDAKLLANHQPEALFSPNSVMDSWSSRSTISSTSK